MFKKDVSNRTLNEKNVIYPLFQGEKYQKVSPITDLSTPEIQKRLKDEIESSELDT